MPSLARLSKRFRAAGINGRLDLSLAWRVSESPLKDHTRYDRGPEIHDEPRRVSLPVGEAQLAGYLRVSDLVELKEAESNSLLKLSKLNDVALSPNPIECQSVSICLRIFCDETIAALRSHTKINNEAASGTVNFLKIELKLWKIFNAKIPRENQAHNDAMKAVIKMPDDPGI